MGGVVLSMGGGQAAFFNARLILKAPTTDVARVGAAVGVSKLPRAASKAANPAATPAVAAALIVARFMKWLPAATNSAMNVPKKALSTLAPTFFSQLVTADTAGSTTEGGVTVGVAVAVRLCSDCATTASFWLRAAGVPLKGASPKLKMPPSAPTSQ